MLSLEMIRPVADADTAAPDPLLIAMKLDPAVPLEITNVSFAVRMPVKVKVDPVDTAVPESVNDPVCSGAHARAAWDVVARDRAGDPDGAGRAGQDRDVAAGVRRHVEKVWLVLS